MFIMKKKLMLAATCLALSMNVMAGDLHVSGNLQGLGNDTLVAKTILTNDVDQTMKVIGKDGAFDFHIQVDQPKNLLLQIRHPKGEGAQPMSGYLLTMAMPGEDLKITGTLSDYTLSGSSYYKQVEQARKVTKPFDEAVKNLSSDYQAKVKQGANEDSLEEVVDKAYQKIQDDMSEASLNYIKAHPDDEGSQYLLYQISADKYKEAIAALSPAVREGRLKTLIDNYAMRSQKTLDREEAKKKVADGKDAPDFTLKSIDGKNISLSSLRGKTVVLDFWGAWCGWCIKGMPKMKEYYAKYKNKLEILGIDCNDTDQKWRDAVKKHELPWLHVRNEGKPDVTVLYGISGFPTKIVVSPEGKISKVIVGESEDFYKYLDETLGK